MHIFTLAIGNDYRKALTKGLLSKEKYAEKHGYTYIQGNEDFWDRNRPVAWSKIPFLLHHLSKLPDGELIWLSDADVLITNPEVKLEQHVLPLLPQNKDLLMTFDACGHINSGNILMRNTPWLRDYWNRVYQQTDCIYHIWWENAAMIKLIEKNEEDRNHIEVSKEHKRFNAYLMGLPGQPLWEPGDFLVHFAGVYTPEKMKGLIEEIERGNVPRLSMF
jgi:SepF-like predicted cell division protein (DUF552 family)